MSATSTDINCSGKGRIDMNKNHEEIKNNSFPSEVYRQDKPPVSFNIMVRGVGFEPTKT